MNKYRAFKATFLPLLFLCSALFWQTVTFADSDNTRLSTKTQTTQLSNSIGLDIQYGAIRYSQFRFSGAQNVGLPSNRYHSARLSCEWLPIERGFGSLGIGLGLGFLKVANVGISQYTDGGRTLQRSASLTAIPLDLFASYHLKYTPGQVLVPYVKAGPNLTLTKQSSDSGAPTRGYAYKGFDWGVGLRFFLNGLDRSSANQFKRSGNIRGTYLIIEYSRSKALNKDTIDLSGDSIRAGLRFEI